MIKKLSLNVVKMQSLIIGSGPNIRKIESQPDAQPSFSVGDQESEMVPNTKYLGIQKDSQLNWDKRVDSIKTKANPGGSTWIVSMRGGATGKSEKLPCPGVRFLKMIPCPGAKVLKQYPVLEFFRTKLCPTVEICKKSIGKYGNVGIQAI